MEPKIAAALDKQVIVMMDELAVRHPHLNNALKEGAVTQEDAKYLVSYMVLVETVYEQTESLLGIPRSQQNMLAVSNHACMFLGNLHDQTDVETAERVAAIRGVTDDYLGEPS